MPAHVGQQHGAEKHGGLRQYMADLVIADAKLAVEVFGMPELKAFTPRPEFLPLVDEARCQAVD